MNKTSAIISIIICAVVVGTGAFYAGISYGKKTAATARTAAFGNRAGGGAGGFGTGAGGNGGFGRGGGGAGGAGGLTIGEVLSKDANSITIKMRDGGSKIVFFGSSTAVTKSAAGNISDIGVGSSVMVAGTANTDGSLTAQSVQLRPEMAGMGAGMTGTSTRQY